MQQGLTIENEKHLYDWSEEVQVINVSTCSCRTQYYMIFYYSAPQLPIETLCWKVHHQVFGQAVTL